MTEPRRTVLITGVSKGIGRALALLLAEQGQRVVGCARTASAIKELAIETAGDHIFSEIDVSDWPSVLQWAGQLQEAEIVPDLIINNAAMMNRNAPLWQIPDDEFRHLLQVNIAGTANIIRAFVPIMIAKGSGIIANISSGWGRSTAANVAPYCASKWAIEGLTQALAQELPAGLAAIAVNPGIIDTDMLRSCWADAASAYPDPKQWAIKAAPFFLDLSVRDNGKALSVPQ